MEKYLSERVKNLATSQTLAMAAKARELRSSGKDVIGLSLGEPDFNICLLYTSDAADDP